MGRRSDPAGDFIDKLHVRIGFRIIYSVGPNAENTFPYLTFHPPARITLTPITRVVDGDVNHVYFWILIQEAVDIGSSSAGNIRI